MYSREGFQSIVVSQQSKRSGYGREQLSDEEDQAPISLSQSSGRMCAYGCQLKKHFTNDFSYQARLTMSMLMNQPSNVVALLQQARMNDGKQSIKCDVMLMSYKEYRFDKDTRT